ncbi:hypothetical protein L1987_13975 [Smallanthus sonchifolius]|uniref:Uncharacterized protein n=1 Tax=Smallanthus sonchifolius TaxID=185202 RepID=A0ACB9JIF7_9ASTR|nr:hypothetical protein L1987_13975 [Smallanthus sonchifolius]
MVARNVLFNLLEKGGMQKQLVIRVEDSHVGVEFDKGSNGSLHATPCLVLSREFVDGAHGLNCSTSLDSYSGNDSFNPSVQVELSCKEILSTHDFTCKEPRHFHRRETLITISDCRLPSNLFFHDIES